jgi:hypothetical protein
MGGVHRRSRQTMTRLLSVGLGKELTRAVCCGEQEVAGWQEAEGPRGGELTEPWWW